MRFIVLGSLLYKGAWSGISAFINVLYSEPYEPGSRLLAERASCNSQNPDNQISRYLSRSPQWPN